MADAGSAVGGAPAVASECGACETGKKHAICLKSAAPGMPAFASLPGAASAAGDAELVACRAAASRVTG